MKSGNLTFLEPSEPLQACNGTALPLPLMISFHVSCGYKSWSLTLRDERRLRVFEDRVLRKIFGSKRDEVTGYWRKLHNEELMICTALQLLFV